MMKKEAVSYTHLKREEGRTIGAMKEIASWLDLEKLERVEAYDISNINGFETVGSMVVYEKGKPQRSDYRKFKMCIRYRCGLDFNSGWAWVATNQGCPGISTISTIRPSGERPHSFIPFSVRMLR